MKTLSISRLSFVGVLLAFVGPLMLGLLVAQSAAAPQQIDGEQVGGWCTDTTSRKCGNAPDEECNDSANRCTGSDSNGSCRTVGTAHSCVVDGACVSLTNQWCY